MKKILIVGYGPTPASLIAHLKSKYGEFEFITESPEKVSLEDLNKALGKLDRSVRDLENYRKEFLQEPVIDLGPKPSAKSSLLGAGPTRSKKRKRGKFWR